MHGPTTIFWANLTTFSLNGARRYHEEEAEEPGLDCPELAEEKKEESRVFDPGVV